MKLFQGGKYVLTGSILRSPDWLEHAIQLSGWEVGGWLSGVKPHAVWLLQRVILLSLQYLNRYTVSGTLYLPSIDNSIPGLHSFAVSSSFQHHFFSHFRLL